MPMVMDLPHETHITLEDGQSKVLLAWEGFDGDDGFEVHYLTVTAAGEARRFDFGPCAVMGLRKTDRLLRDINVPSVGLGFRNPDIRYWDLYRKGDGYRLLIRFTDQQVEFEHTLKQPQIRNDRTFIQRYDGEVGL